MNMFTNILYENWAHSLIFNDKRDNLILNKQITLKISKLYYSQLTNSLALWMEDYALAYPHDLCWNFLACLDFYSEKQSSWIPKTKLWPPFFNIKPWSREYSLPCNWCYSCTVAFSNIAYTIIAAASRCTAETFFSGTCEPFFIFSRVLAFYVLHHIANSTICH